jgi:hypothetical protein
VRTFECACGQPLFFDNTRCLACGAEVAYDPSSRTLRSLTSAGDGTWSLAGDERRPPPRFWFCGHRTQAALCNWLIPDGEPHTTCLSCRLTRTIPDLSRPRNVKRLGDIESAKRRVLHALLDWGLPIEGRSAAMPGGLAFDFLESLPGEPPVLTGHAGGLVTINVAEADDDYREQHRDALSEPYRTVLGHLRHEIGHYYWNLLVRDTAWLPRFRELFGDERADYGAALQRNYGQGPPPDWRDRFISSYAAVHPWEDWAESWAHYMHLRATLQTVASYDIDTTRVKLQITPFTTDVLYRREPAARARDFLDWINAWVILTAVLNETARSMGQPDIYPFVMNRAVVTKLHFVHCVVEEGGAHARAPAPPHELGRPTG